MAKILRFDLGKMGSEIQRLEEEDERIYFGANGMAVKILLEETERGLDPFSHENLVVLGVGPITDAPIFGTARGYIATKSPLTGGYFDSTFGGRFAISQKRTGFDVIVVGGKAEGPVYLYVDEDGGRILPAAELWGLTTREAIERLRQLHGPKADVLAIGPAGENRVRYACLVHEWEGRGGVAGRGGIGAVLGSKKVKAIVVKGGKRKTPVADPGALQELAKKTRENLKSRTAGLSKYGTPILVALYQTQGALGTRNLQREVNDRWEEISAERIKENYFSRHVSCAACPVACGKICRVVEGEYSGIEWKMPEYETLFALGTMTDVCELPTLIAANRECDLLGLDTISMGVTISFAMECAERGLLPREMAKDVEIKFGDGERVLHLIRMTSKREGFGDFLAEGSFRMAELLGDEAKRLLYGVKGLEIPGHSARVFPINAIGYATNTRGGSHHDHRPTFRSVPAEDPLHRELELQIKFVIDTQNFTAIGDSMTMCRFVMEQGFGIRLNEDHLRLINAVTGWGLSLDELTGMAERIVTMERLFNCREGFDRSKDTLPHRVMEEPVPDGPAKGRYFPRPMLDLALSKYYELRGWDERGVPSRFLLERLALGAHHLAGMPQNGQFGTAVA